MRAYVIKGWHSDGNEFYIAHIEPGDGCWAEEASLGDAQLFSSAEHAERVIRWLLVAGPGSYVVKTVNVELV